MGWRSVGGMSFRGGVKGGWMFGCAKSRSWGGVGGIIERSEHESRCYYWKRKRGGGKMEEEEGKPQ